MQCGGRKTSPRTSTIVQFIFYFWSFEISVNILRNQKSMIGLDSYSRRFFNYLGPILIYFSLWIDCLFEIRKLAMFPLAFVAVSLQGHWLGFISRNYVVWPIFFLVNFDFYSTPCTVHLRKPCSACIYSCVFSPYIDIVLLILHFLVLWDCWIQHFYLGAEWRSTRG